MRVTILDERRLRVVLDYLYDGHPGTMKHLLQCRNFREEHDIYLYFYRNGIKGKKLVEFFQNESGTVDGEGSLNAINEVIKRIRAERFAKLKANDLK